MMFFPNPSFLDIMSVDHIFKMHPVRKKAKQIEPNQKSKANFKSIHVFLFDSHNFWAHLIVSYGLSYHF